MNIREIILDLRIPVKKKSEMLLEYYLGNSIIHEKEREIMNVIFECFLLPDWNIWKGLKESLRLESIYDFADKQYPDLKQKYYNWIRWSLNWYIRYLVQKYTKWMKAYFKISNSKRVHIFNTFWVWIGRYVLKDLQVFNNSAIIDDWYEISFSKLELKINDLLHRSYFYNVFLIDLWDMSSINSSLDGENNIKIYMNSEFFHHIGKISRNVYEITPEFLCYLSEEISIQICCQKAKKLLYPFDAENFSRELMCNFNELRLIFNPIVRCRIIV